MLLLFQHAVIFILIGLWKHGPLLSVQSGPIGHWVKSEGRGCVVCKHTCGGRRGEPHRETETERAVPVCWSVTLLPYSCLTREFVSEKCWCSHRYFSARVGPREALLWETRRRRRESERERCTSSCTHFPVVQKERPCSGSCSLDRTLDNDRLASAAGLFCVGKECRGEGERFFFFFTPSSRFAHYLDLCV